MSFAPSPTIACIVVTTVFDSATLSAITLDAGQLRDLLARRVDGLVVAVVIPRADHDEPTMVSGEAELAGGAEGRGAGAERGDEERRERSG